MFFSPPAAVEHQNTWFVVSQKTMTKTFTGSFLLTSWKPSTSETKKLHSEKCFSVDIFSCDHPVRHVFVATTSCRTWIWCRDVILLLMRSSFHTSVWFYVHNREILASLSFVGGSRDALSGYYIQSIVCLTCRRRVKTSRRVCSTIFDILSHTYQQHPLLDSAVMFEGS